MKTIHRYTVAVDDLNHNIPLYGAAKPVAFAAYSSGARHYVEFWAEATQDVAVSHLYRVFGTGHPIPDEYQYVGTCPRTSSGLVWHLYEKK